MRLADVSLSEFAVVIDLPPSAIPVFKLGIPPWIDQPCAVAEA
jgi:hypothetical protein